MGDDGNESAAVAAPRGTEEAADLLDRGSEAGTTPESASKESGLSSNDGPSDDPHLPRVSIILRRCDNMVSVIPSAQEEEKERLDEQ